MGESSAHPSYAIPSSDPNVPPEVGYEYGPWQYQVETLDDGTQNTTNVNQTWTIGHSVEIKKTLGVFFKATFDLADWANAGGSASVDLTSTDSIEYNRLSPTPHDRFGDTWLQAGTTFQPVIVYRTRIRRLLFDHYLPDGHDLYTGSNVSAGLGDNNTGQNGTGYGQWPQAKEEGVGKSYPDWILIVPEASPRPSGSYGIYDPNASKRVS